MSRTLSVYFDENRGEYKPEDVTLRHWDQLVPNTRLAKTAMGKELNQFAKELPKKALILARDLELVGLSSPIYEKIQTIIQARCNHVLRDSYEE
jgi:hypothetical protein